MGRGARTIDKSSRDMRDGYTLRSARSTGPLRKSEASARRPVAGTGAMAPVLTAAKKKHGPEPVLFAKSVFSQAED